MQVTVRPNQSLFDIAIQEYGRAEAAFAVAKENDLSITEDLTTGQILNLPEGIKKDIVAEHVQNVKLVIASDYTTTEEFDDTPLSVSLTQLINEQYGADGYIGIEVRGGIKPYAFSWTDENMVEVSTSQNLNWAQAGQYNVLVTDDEGTQVTLQALIVSVGDNNVYLVDEFGNFIVDENGEPIIA